MIRAIAILRGSVIRRQKGWTVSLDARNPARQARFLVATLAFHFCMTEIRASDDTNIVEQFRVTKDGDFILVPVMIGDDNYQFVLDTGTTGSVLDSSLEDKLGEPLGSVRLNEKKLQPLYRMPRAFVGTSRIPLRGETLCMDLSGFRRSSGHDIRGFLGMDFLRKYVIRIDFDRGDVAFLRSAPRSECPPFRLSYNRFRRPTVDIEFADGLTVPFAIDTGAIAGATGHITTRTFDRLRQEGLLTLLEKPARGVDLFGKTKFRGGCIERLKVGDFTHRQLYIAEGAADELGLDYLSRFVVTFDFPNDRLYLEKGASFSRIQRFHLSGLAFGRDDGRTIVDEVDEGSVADSAGIKVGDELCQVNGEDAGELSLFEIRRLLSSRAEHLRLILQRGNDRYKVDLRLAERGS
jgi:hypothetical protein